MTNSFQLSTHQQEYHGPWSILPGSDCDAVVKITLISDSFVTLLETCRQTMDLCSLFLLLFKHLPSDISVGLNFKKVGSSETETYGPSGQVYFRILFCYPVDVCLGVSLTFEARGHT